MTTTFELIDFQVTDAIALLTFNRPAAANAISTLMANEIVAAVRLAEEADARVLVASGEGRFFCAGADLKEKVSAAERFEKIRGALDAVAAFSQLSIAAVNGICLGGGLELALACDLRVAGASASFGLPEISFGMLPAAGGPQRLARLIGAPQAKWLVMSGARIDSDRALELGIVSSVVPDGALVDEVERLARPVADRAGYAVRTAKSVIDGGLEMDLAAALVWEYEAIDAMASPSERAAEVGRASAESGTYSRIFGATATKEATDGL